MKTIFITLSLMVLLFGVYYFWIGFHNIDLAVNAMNLQTQFNAELEQLTLNKWYLKEVRLTGEEGELSKLYMDGLSSIIQGFHLSMFGAFILGLSVRYEDD